MTCRNPVVNRAGLACALLLAALGAPPGLVQAQDQVLVVAGLGHQTCFPSAPLTAGLNLTFQYSYLAQAQTGWVLDVPFPARVEGLAAFRLVVLADVPAAALGSFMGRRGLRQFVERGGGLLVFGGPFSLGKGGFAGVAFEPALPVTTTGPWDLVAAQSPAVQVARPSPLTDGLHWEQGPVCPYYQQTTAKPGAETLLQCDGFPLLATGTLGQGRSAVFTATYLGVPAANQPLLYEWPDYPSLLSRVVAWLLQR